MNTLKQNSPMAKIMAWRDIARTEAAFFRTKDRVLRPAARKREKYSCDVRLPKDGDKSLVHTHIYTGKNKANFFATFEDIVNMVCGQMLQPRIRFFHIPVIDERNGNLMGVTSYMAKESFLAYMDEKIKKGETAGSVRYDCNLFGVKVDACFAIRFSPAPGYEFDKNAFDKKEMGYKVKTAN